MTQPNPPRRSRARVAAAAATLIALGWWLPGVLIGDGVDRLRDPARRAAAGDAIDLAASTCLENPAARLLVRAVRVSQVRRVPGSCTVGPAPEGADPDLRVVLRAYGPFGVPIRTITATCGGNHVTC